MRIDANMCPHKLKMFQLCQEVLLPATGCSNETRWNLLLVALQSPCTLTDNLQLLCHSICLIIAVIVLDQWKDSNKRAIDNVLKTFLPFNKLINFASQQRDTRHEVTLAAVEDTLHQEGGINKQVNCAVYLPFSRKHLPPWILLCLLPCCIILFNYTL